jgi:carbamoyl-phosphate synthase small subunit
MKTRALIALEDGTCFEGRAFAGAGEAYGELVFNTSMTGYQEILTDPSYHGQIVTLTYPLIGNYGINDEDVESWKPHAAGLIVNEASRMRSNWRSTHTLEEYLVASGILGVDDVDTRAVTLHIRSRGAMKCVMSTEDLDCDSLVAKAQASPGLVGRDLSSEVSTGADYDWPREGAAYRIAVLDCGIKTNQLRMMADRGISARVFPNRASAADILAAGPDGFFISNGPGDPDTVPQVLATIRELVEHGLPTFGICFGHQLLALAHGGQTYKLKFGHRGANQPVKNLRTGLIEITSQNHGFCVNKDTLPADLETTHINLNDGTSEGLRHTRRPMFSVQYHPEAAPGPHDAAYLFDEFIANMGAVGA